MANELFTDVEKAQLERTQNIRGQIITEMMKDGKIPESEENRAFLMKALDGMDKVNLTKAKIKSDDANAKNNATATAMVAEMLRRVTARPADLQRTSMPSLPTDVPFIPVEGEAHIGVQTLQLDDIMNPAKSA